MSNDTIIEFENPQEPREDCLTSLLRDGATRLIRQAVLAELAELMDEWRRGAMSTVAVRWYETATCPRAS